MRVRFCVVCGKKLAPAQVLYCSHRHRVAAYRVRKLLDRLPASIHELEQRARAAAPAGSVGYRLGLATLAGSWIYPSRLKKTLRFDGSRSSRPYFELDPFEPPVVPIAARYGVIYVGEDGRDLPLTSALATGIYIEPIRRIKIEDGQRCP